MASEQAADLLRNQGISELALDAATELDRLSKGKQTNVESAIKLIDFLEKEELNTDPEKALKNMAPTNAGVLSNALTAYKGSRVTNDDEVRQIVEQIRQTVRNLESSQGQGLKDLVSFFSGITSREPCCILCLRTSSPKEKQLSCLTCRT